MSLPPFSVTCRHHEKGILIYTRAMKDDLGQVQGMLSQMESRHGSINATIGYKTSLEYLQKLREQDQ